MIITGTVLDANRIPLMGVNIFPLKNGSSYGVGGITDYDGNFEIESDDLSEDQIVKFSYIGFAPVEIQAKELKNKTIIMMESAFLLEEVIVIAKKPKDIKKLNKIYGAIYATAGLLMLGLIIYNIRE